MDLAVEVAHDDLALVRLQCQANKRDKKRRHADARSRRKGLRVLNKTMQYTDYVVDN